MYAFFGGLTALFINAESIIVPCIVFICLDFVLGIITDIKSSIRRKERFGIRSGKVWKTIYKLASVMIAIILCQLYTESFIDWLGVNIGKMVAGVIAGVELWSIFGHLCYISNWYVFDVLKSVFKKEIEDKVGHRIDDLQK